MIRRLGLLLAGTAVLAACAGPASAPRSAPRSAPHSAPRSAPLRATPTDTPTGSTAVACPESGIRITAGEVDAAMGLRALGIVLVNCGTRDYVASGYPVVRVLDADREPLEVAVSNGSMRVSARDSYDVTPVPVTLRPGDRVTARVLWRNTVTDPTVPATDGR